MMATKVLIIDTQNLKAKTKWTSIIGQGHQLHVIIRHHIHINLEPKYQTHLYLQSGGGVLFRHLCLGLAF